MLVVPLPHHDFDTRVLLRKLDYPIRRLDEASHPLVGSPGVAILENQFFDGPREGGGNVARSRACGRQ